MGDPIQGRQLGDDRAAQIRAGNELEKPGWSRVNFSFVMSDAEAGAIIAAVDDVAARASDLARTYAGDTGSARFRFHESPEMAAAPLSRQAD